MKLCSKCKAQPAAPKNGGYCPDCRREYERAWRARHRDNPTPSRLPEAKTLSHYRSCAKRYLRAAGWKEEAIAELVALAEANGLPGIRE